MRLGRLTVVAIVATVLVGASPSPLGAQAEPTDPTDGAAGRQGSDFSGDGFYLGAGASNDGRSATVDAGSTVALGDLVPVTGSGGEVAGYVGPGGGGGASGSGGPPPLACRYVPTRNAGPAGFTEMVRMCEQLPGQYSGETILVPDAAPAGPAAAVPVPVVVDPRVVAELARSELVFPAPVPRSSPGMDVGTYAQLPTAFWLEGWAPVSESASAGLVTATVTARPLRQEWTIRDSVRGTTETVACDGPGEAVATVGEPVGCGWTPVHSSAGQSSTGGLRGEACFETTVTVSWSVSWSSTLGPGGPLGAGTSTTDTCLVVAEIQAIVTDA